MAFSLPSLGLLLCRVGITATLHTRLRGRGRLDPQLARCQHRDAETRPKRAQPGVVLPGRAVRHFMPPAALEGSIFIFQMKKLKPRALLLS